MKMRLGVTFLGYFTLRVEVSMADISNSICSLNKVDEKLECPNKYDDYNITCIRLRKGHTLVQR